jgi:hypothetical protein
MAISDRSDRALAELMLANASARIKEVEGRCPP